MFIHPLQDKGLSSPIFTSSIALIHPSQPDVSYPSSTLSPTTSRFLSSTAPLYSSIPVILSPTAGWKPLQYCFYPICRRGWCRWSGKFVNLLASSLPLLALPPLLDLLGTVGPNAIVLYQIRLPWVIRSHPHTLTQVIMKETNPINFSLEMGSSHRLWILILSIPNLGGLGWGPFAKLKSRLSWWCPKASRFLCPGVWFRPISTFHGFILWQCEI